MSNESELAEIRTAISNALEASEVQHGDDRVKRPELEELYKRERELLGRINRKNRGPRAQGFRLRHS